MPLDNKSRTRRKAYFDLLKHSYVGMEMGFAVLIGVFIGRYLDLKVFDDKTSPWLTMLFLAFGMVAAGRAFYRAAVEMRKKSQDKEES